MNIFEGMHTYITGTYSFKLIVIIMTIMRETSKTQLITIFNLYMLISHSPYNNTLFGKPYLTNTSLRPFSIEQTNYCARCNIMFLYCHVNHTTAHLTVYIRMTVSILNYRYTVIYCNAQPSGKFKPLYILLIG